MANIQSSIADYEAYINDKQDLIELDRFISTLSNVYRVEILPYHTLGVFKWEELKIPYQLEGIKPPTKERVDNANRLLHVDRYTRYLDN